MYQTTIFDIMYPKYKITKPIRLIELFAGYGSQYLALKYLGANVKHYKICEWATKSIQAYNDLHIQDYFDYSGDLSDDNILKVLVELLKILSPTNFFCLLKFDILSISVVLELLKEI